MLIRLERELDWGIAMAEYHYHYCVVRCLQAGQVSYTTGIYKTSRKIKFGETYDNFIDSFKHGFGIKENEPIDFVITSLTLIDEEI